MFYNFLPHKLHTCTKFFYKTNNAWFSCVLSDLSVLVSGLGTSNRALGLRPHALFEVPPPETHTNKSDNTL